MRKRKDDILANHCPSCIEFMKSHFAAVSRGVTNYSAKFMSHFCSIIRRVRIGWYVWKIIINKSSNSGDALSIPDEGDKLRIKLNGLRTVCAIVSVIIRWALRIVRGRVGIMKRTRAVLRREQCEPWRMRRSRYMGTWYIRTDRTIVKHATERRTSGTTARTCGSVRENANKAFVIVFL